MTPYCYFRGKYENFFKANRYGQAIRMSILDWLFTVVRIERHLTNTYYIGMAIIVVLALALAYRTRFIKLGAMLWLTSGLICLGWEATLFATGIRHYNFAALLELLYHGLTEAGPGLIIMTIVAHYANIIDLSRFRDNEGV